MSTDLPPQAYTREILQEAFQWLQNQPEVVRASVHTPERLVSLYRNSQRLNDVDAPVSSKKFITDLKDLASSLEQFKGDLNPSSSREMNTPKEAPEPKKAEPMPSEPKSSHASPSVTTISQTKSTTTTVRMENMSIPLDSKSQQRVKQVRDRFNLSSDSEALRVLISLGFEKFSEI